MTPAQLARTVAGVVDRAVAAGELDVPVPTADAVKVERPRQAGRGDFATGIALRLARPAGAAPHQVAAVLARRLAAVPGIARVDVAEPGFLNVTLAPAAHADLVAAIRAAGPRYGHAAAAPATAPAAPPAAQHPRTAAVRRLRAAAGMPAAPGAPGAPGAPPRDTTGLGADAFAWALTRPPAGDAATLDPAVHLPQRDANPLFRVRYAHARTRALLRNAADLGFGPDEGAGTPGPAAHALLGALADWPRVVRAAARDQAPDKAARALEEVADAFLDFQTRVPVLPAGDEEATGAHRARLALADAAGAVLAGGLALLGVSAPDHL